ncbi:MAG: hypothetical protein IJ501_05075 [Bacilli bacterium]|nr:hypothetical protein [Bacilli bacterium]
MKGLNSAQFEKSIRRNRIFLIVSLVFLFATIFLIVLGVKNQNKEIPNPVSMKDLKFNSETKDDVYAYIDVNTEPYLFAAYENDGVEDDAKFYFVMDANNNLYVVYMESDDYKKLNVKNIKENPIKIVGLTKEIQSDVKELAISSYNEEMGEIYLTDENFKDYVGLIYLDMVTDGSDLSIYYIAGGVSFLFFLGFFTTYLTGYLKNKKIFGKYSKEELERISSEIYQIEETNPYSKMKLYLLNDYIVDTSNNIVILRYTDILWAYPYEYRYNGLLVNKNIKVINNKNKIYEIANTKFLDKNKDLTLQEILNKLAEKDLDIILGYNKENKKKFKEKLKNQK